MEYVNNILITYTHWKYPFATHGFNKIYIFCTPRFVIGNIALRFIEGASILECINTWLSSIGFHFQSNANFKARTLSFIWIAYSIKANIFVVANNI